MRELSTNDTKVAKNRQTQKPYVSQKVNSYEIDNKILFKAT